MRDGSDIQSLETFGMGCITSVSVFLMGITSRVKLIYAGRGIVGKWVI